MDVTEWDGQLFVRDGHGQHACGMAKLRADTMWWSSVRIDKAEQEYSWNLDLMNVCIIVHEETLRGEVYRHDKHWVKQVWMG